MEPIRLDEVRGRCHSGQPTGAAAAGVAARTPARKIRQGARRARAVRPGDRAAAGWVLRGAVGPPDPPDGASGDLYLGLRLVEMPGKGHRYDISIAYNSLFAEESGRLGYGWRSTAFVKAVESGNDLEIQDGDGTEFTYTGPGPNYASPDGVFREVTQVGDNWEEEDTDGTVYVYDGTNAGRIDRICDAADECHYFRYDGSDLVRLEYASGRSVYFGYDVNDRLSAVEAPGARVVYFEYDGSADLVKVTGPELCQTQLGYDGSHRLVRAMDPEGHAAYYGYDTNDRVTAFELGGAATYFEYAGDNINTTVTDAEGKVWSTGSTTSAPWSGRGTRRGARSSRSILPTTC